MKSLNTFEPTIKYYDLQMSLNDLNTAPCYQLPNEYKFEFWDNGNNLDDWLNIHISTGEFASLKDAKATFDSFYSNIINELDKRVLFITDNSNKKIGTATLSPCKEDSKTGIIDWFAISKFAQGKKLSKPLLSKIVQTAKDLGLNKIILHTQTNSWVASKIYLDFGFEPLNTNEIDGWKILKTITNHPKLAEFDSVTDEEIFDPLMLNIKTQLAKLYTNFSFNVWYINDRNDVFVQEDGKFFEYSFFDNGNVIVKK